MKKVAFQTLGCKVNQYETEAMCELFENHGYKKVSFDSFADVYVVNTCSVTATSDKKSRNTLRKAKRNNSNAIVVAVGCYSQIHSKEIESIPEIDIAIGSTNKHHILRYIDEFLLNNNKINAVIKEADYIPNTNNFSEELQSLKINKYRNRTRAFVKIQDGCNQFCSYCIIPYARGSIRSKLPIHVIGEVTELSNLGFKEVVLSGIHIASYGKDFENSTDSDLLDLLIKIHAIPNIERIRLGSIELSLLSKDFITTAKSMKKLCPHYHISLQSGCNSTLKRMNRKYTVESFEKIIYALRENIPDIAITTDIIVGFPGETDDEFLSTYNFLDRIKFKSMHVFKYSPREGTTAAKFPDQIPSDVKNTRSNLLLKLSAHNNNEFCKKYLDKSLPVLFEQSLRSDKSFIEGLSPNYIRVVSENTSPSLKGTIKNVKLTGLTTEYMIGTLEPVK